MSSSIWHTCLFLHRRPYGRLFPNRPSPMDSSATACPRPHLFCVRPRFLVQRVTSLAPVSLVYILYSYQSPITPYLACCRGVRYTDRKMSQYIASVPEDGQVRPEIRSFFEEFYKISDTPDTHEKYADHFTKGGRLIMGPNEANGRDGMSLPSLAALCGTPSVRCADK